METSLEKPRIGVVIGTIREGRFGERPAHWIIERASRHPGLDLALEVVDLRDYALPFLGMPEILPESEDSTTAAPESAVARWKRMVNELDGYLFITAEYNHSISGVLKNALDHAYAEFNKKPAAFIGYGGVGGARAVEQLRLICVELQMAPTRTAVHIGMEPYRGVTQQGAALADFDFLNRTADTMLDELSWWTHTLKAGRERSAAIK